MIWRYISHKLAISENMLERFVVRLYCELTTVEKMLEFLYSKYNSLSSCDYFFSVVARVKNSACFFKLLPYRRWKDWLCSEGKSDCCSTNWMGGIIA